MSAAKGRLRRVLLDVSPLRLDPAYRMLWAGQVVNGVGTQITRIALPYQVYVLTGSTLAIAALTACQLIPLLVFSLGAGSVADAVDRRKVIAVTQVGMAACSVALVLLALHGSPSVLALLAVAFVSWSFSAFDQPSRASAVPRLVPAERLPAALALNQLNFQLQSVIGPAIGGILIATIGVAGAYAVDVVSFSASLLALTRIPALPPLAGARRAGLSAIRESMTFLRRRPVILATFVIDLDAMIFGMPESLFPVLALDVFRTGPTGVGLLAAAPAAGAFLGALLSGWLSHVRRPGRAVIVAVAIWGFAIVLFGLTTLWPALFAIAVLCLAIAGAADVFSAVLRNTIVQLETPDELRGRVSAVTGLVVRSGPATGDIEAAAVASVIGAQASAISGGILCLVGLFGVVRFFPELARHELGRRDGTAGEAPATPA